MALHSSGLHTMARSGLEHGYTCRRSESNTASLLNSHLRTMLQEYTCTTGIKAGLYLLTNNWILLLQYLREHSDKQMNTPAAIFEGTFWRTIEYSPAAIFEGTFTFAESRNKGQQGWAKDQPYFCKYIHVFCKPQFSPFSFTCCY